MASLFDQLESEAFRKGIQARSKEANTWFAKKAKALGPIGAPQMLKDDRLEKTEVNSGDMVMYTYDPKTKATLPYYDTFPLVLPLENYNDGFLGLNFHYLSIPMRLKLLSVITEYATDDRMDENTKIRLTWNRIKRNPMVKPTVKRYLASHVKSPFRKIEADEMMLAVLLPVQRFVKATDNKVYSDSRRMSNQRRV